MTEQPAMTEKTRKKKTPTDLERRAMDQMRRNLRAIAVRHFDGNYSAWAKAAGLGTANSLYNFMKKRADFLSTQTLDRLRRAVPGLTMNDLTGDSPSPLIDILVVPIRQKAAVGHWAGRNSPQPGDYGRIALPVEWDYRCSEAVLVDDHHADEVYAKGTRLGCLPLASLDRDLRQGDRVLIRRIRDGGTEFTVREIAEVDGQWQLVYRSRQSAFGTIVQLPGDHARKGSFFEIEGDRLEIFGKVVLALSLEH